MTMITITQNTPVLVAIDIAKARHEVLIAVPGKKRRCVHARCLPPDENSMDNVCNTSLPIG